MKSILTALLLTSLPDFDFPAPLPYTRGMKATEQHAEQARQG